jgi:hypothetical protein
MNILNSASSILFQRLLAKAYQKALKQEIGETGKGLRKLLADESGEFNP